MMNIDIFKGVAGKAIVHGKKWAPEILTTAGVVGVVASAVMASKATLKLEEKIALIERGKEAVAERSKDDDYSEKDRRNDLTYIYVRGGMDIVKLYLPSVTLGVASLAMILSSHGIMRKRNAGLVAAYKALETTFGGYKDRVVDYLGVDKARELEYDYELTNTEDESGESKEIAVRRGGMSPYARYFEEATSTAWDRLPDYNLQYLRAQQNFANDRLRIRGHVFLNEVYQALGLPHTKEGAVVGWVLGNGDDYIDFGLPERGSEEERAYFFHEELSILLDFNVDGVIFDLI